MIKRLICLVVGHVARDSVFTTNIGLESDSGPIVRNCIIFECARCDRPVIDKCIEDNSGLAMMLTLVGIGGGDSGRKPS